MRDWLEQREVLLADRRQRAREAFDDVWNSRPDDPRDGRGRDPQTWAARLQRAREEAIGTATRVKITEDVIEAAQQAFPILRDVDEGRIMLAAAFRAAGFEVEE